MRYKKFILNAILVLGFGLTGLQAQESVNTTGGNASGVGGSASYSVGQVVYTTNTGTTGSVVQGVQQVFEITVVNSIAEAKSINLSVRAYPNPTTDQLQLKVDASKSLSIQSMSYQLYDMQGNMLQNKKLTDTDTQIDMSVYVPETYFLKIIHNNIEIKTFKIVKL